MKRFLALTLAAVMMLLLVGCQTPTLSRGSIEGDVYTNNYLGFTFTKPSSWVYSTDEEIAAAINMGADLLGDDLKAALENNPSIYDMMVKDIHTGTNISVGYENLAKTLSSNITEEQYIDALKEQLDSVSIMTVTFSDEIETVKLGKTKFTKVVCTTSVYGVSMKQVYYLNKQGSYMGIIIATVVNGYTVDEVEAMFQ